MNAKRSGRSVWLGQVSARYENALEELKSYAKLDSSERDPKTVQEAVMLVSMHLVSDTSMDQEQVAKATQVLGNVGAAAKMALPTIKLYADYSSEDTKAAIQKIEKDLTTKRVFEPEKIVMTRQEFKEKKFC